MRYELSLKGDTFTPVVEAFDRRLLATLDRMRRQGLQEGSITLRLNIELSKQWPIDEDGQEHEVFVPSFEHEVSSQIVQKDKASGKIDEDFVLVRGADGMPALVSRDSENLFDMVERMEAGDDGG
ncbi:hypothetical protein [Agathobaculum sp.]|uniref:hypothetical protein n=1 Tax=Agathobaculum sp. TaxID=2048138 RepID=UPI0027BA2161|nr:hypothetical protein [Agathobaculum sp.]